VKFNPKARIDTGDISDTRGSSGGGSAGGLGGLGGALGGALGGGGLGKLGGGAGILGIIVFLTLQFLGGGGTGRTSGLGGALGQVLGGGGGGTIDNTKLESECKTGADANDNLDCAITASVNSIQDYWTDAIGSIHLTHAKSGVTYERVDTKFFAGQVNTACGAADSGAGPFYCPGDKLVYIDLTFFDDLVKQFGAEGGLFVDAYVLAHEYGHHVQDLTGIESAVQSRQGADSDSVRLELQADCFAGVWANHATTVPDPQTGEVLITEVTQDDINRALDTAARIGDDYIQKNLGGGQVDQNTFTHGSSQQREKWFTTGYQTGDANQCDTFETSNLG
jgi:predicted metalloprotease